MQQSTFNTARTDAQNAILKFPSSAVRGQTTTYIRVIERAFVAAGGWRLTGEFYKPGSRRPRCELPTPLVAVEWAGRTRAGRDAEYVYILWRFDDRAFEWRETLRSHSRNGDWQWAICPAARKLLTDGPLDERIARQLDELNIVIDRAIDEVDPELKPMVCAAIQERLAAGRVAA